MKWYEQILSGMRSLLGMDPEAAEAEVHAELQKVGTMDDLKAKIKSEVETDIKNQVTAQFSEQIKGLEKDKETLISERDTLKSDLDKANAEVERLKKNSAEITKIKTETGNEGSKSGGPEMPIWEAYKKLIS